MAYSDALRDAHGVGLRRKWRAFGQGLSFTAAAFLFLAGPAWAASPQKFAGRVEALRTAYGVPGVSIAIVENGKPTLVRGWGIRQVGNAEPVNERTIFFIGSTGKAITVAALAVLVDRGKLRWDDRVIDHMADFRMWDPWVTREITVRDLLVHRSGLGLGAGDLLFNPNSDLSREETVRRLRYIKPTTSFRSAYAYDNVLYIAAGRLIEQISGRSWEQFVRENVLQTLEMSETAVSDTEFYSNPNHAQRHTRLGGAIMSVGAQTPLDGAELAAANVAPAGGIASNAADMSRWLLTLLGHGRASGTRRLFSEEQAKQMWTPVTVQPIEPTLAELAPLAPQFSTYGLGWEIQDYRGAKLIWHSGSVSGSRAVVALLPGKNVGIFVAANSEEGELVHGLMYELLDHYLGLKKSAWPEKLHADKIASLNRAAKAVTAAASSPARVGPSLSLNRYVGDFVDPWYGSIKVRQRGEDLHIEFPHSVGMSGPLTHYQYDTFRSNPSFKWIEPAYVTFSLDAKGKIASVTMKAVSPLADFSYDFQDLLFSPAVTDSR